jgi:hypothetical protein
VFEFDIGVSSAVASDTSAGVKLSPLSPNLLEKMHRYWCAANYLTATGGRTAAVKRHRSRRCKCKRTSSLKRDVEVPPSGGLWLGNENPFANIFDPADRAKGWLTAFDAETGNVLEVSRAAPHARRGDADSRWAGVRCGSLRPDLRAGRGQGTILWQRNAAQSTGGGIVTYGAGGRQLIGVASGMSHRCGPGGAQQSRFLVYGLR